MEIGLRTKLKWRHGQAVRQGPAKPLPPVRIWVTPPGERKLRLPVLDTQVYRKTRKWHSAIRKIQGRARWNNRGSMRLSKFRAIADKEFRTAGESPE